MGLAKVAAGVGRGAAGGGGGAKLSDSSGHASGGALLTIGALPKPAAGEGAIGTGRAAAGVVGFAAAGAGGGLTVLWRMAAMSTLPTGT